MGLNQERKSPELMMELQITNFFNSVSPSAMAASMAEIGNHAAKITWQNSKLAGERFLILDDEEKISSAREFFISTGGWTGQEVHQWSIKDLNALFLQWIATDMREPVGFELGPDTTPEQWIEYQQQAEDGQVSGRIFKAEDGEIYFYIGE